MDIFLLGYMGSGKSTIGALLAQKLQRPFIDFDAYIEHHEAMSIKSIFENKGEIYFRKKEMHYLRQLLEEDINPRVIALGGGTPCYGGNMEILSESPVTTIYINTPFKKLAERLWIARKNRPLVSSKKSYEDLEDFVRKHLFERSYFYNQAQIKIKVAQETPEETVEEIIASLF